jgi:hypothetical protein
MLQSVQAVLVELQLAEALLEIKQQLHLILHLVVEAVDLDNSDLEVLEVLEAVEPTEQTVAQMEQMDLLATDLAVLVKEQQQQILGMEQSLMAVAVVVENLVLVAMALVLVAHLAVVEAVTPLLLTAQMAVLILAVAVVVRELNLILKLRDLAVLVEVEKLYLDI